MRPLVLTTSGNVSEHSTGAAVDIALINGIPMLGHQGPGTITEAVIKDLLQLQGTMQPHQIISLMDYFGADNTFAMADHDDHVHVGYTPSPGRAPAASPSSSRQILKPDQWQRLIDRLGEIDNPTVPTKPSDAALPAPKGRKHGDRASAAHLPSNRGRPRPCASRSSSSSSRGPSGWSRGATSAVSRSGCWSSASTAPRLPHAAGSAARGLATRIPRRPRPCR